MEQIAEKTFKPLGKVSLGDWERGLILAVIGAVLTVLYDSFSNGLPTSWSMMKPAIIKALGVGITTGIAYILKNLGTGSGGQLLTNQPPKEVVKDAPKA